MRRHFAQMVETAQRADGEVDLERLGAIVAADQRQLRRAHRQQSARYAAALESMAHAISVYDANQRLVFCNRQFLELYRLPKHIGRRGTSFRRVLQARVAANTHIGDDPVGYVEERMEIARRQEQRTSVLRLNSGQIVSITHQPLVDGGWVSTHKDITEFHLMQEELAHLAYHDTLTGLPNRYRLHQCVEQSIIDADGMGSFALLFMDLDGFKAINDTLGHSSGDQLLRQVAERVLATVGDEGLVGRVGGDEFAVAMRLGSMRSDARHLAMRLIEAAATGFSIDGHAANVAFSIGIAVAPGDGSTPDGLLRNADLALYAAKHEKRGGYRFFEPAMDRALRDRRRLERDLRLALERGEFELHFQPILNLRTQNFSGFEALLRWTHPDDGPIAPSRFIPVAEDTGLIVPIGEWVIRQALAEAATWPPHLRIAVNVSSIQFQRGNIVSTLINAIGSSGIAPERVEIEITESVFLENSTAHLDALRQLHALGLKIALDDFGTGFSALSYLISFPFDKIKIDGSFVRALDNAAGAHAIVRSVAEIGNRMGMETTAEGIETPEQLRNVHAVGYTEAQGFLIARPMPAELVRELLNDIRSPAPATPAAQRATG